MCYVTCQNTWALGGCVATPEPGINNYKYCLSLSSGKLFHKCYLFSRNIREIEQTQGFFLSVEYLLKVIRIPETFSSYFLLQL